MSMYCYQCEQTAQGAGCTAGGVCGKTPEAAALQDLLVHAAKGLAQYAHRLDGLGAADREANVLILELLFSTVTNVNFDADRLERLLQKARQVGERLRDTYEQACRRAGKEPESLCDETDFPAGTRETLLARAEALRLDRRKAQLGEDVVGLQELALYGLKGAAAYADHARILGVANDAIFAAFNEVLDTLARNPEDIDALTALALRVGELNLQVMELLDQANTTAYGHPEPTTVRVTPVAGKCILVSGHDLKDLADLLDQTAGKGINVYTHGEMLPCCAYPGLKKHPHLVGNYGGAWQDQAKEFDAFPGAILMTTNCIQRPRERYQGRIFTTGLVAWPGVQHIEAGPDGKKNFSPVLAAALAAPGFDRDAEPRTITIGFARQAVLGVAEKIVQAVTAGKIRRFFLIGGCDGAKPGRNYYTDLAQAVPKDCVILTLACGKYRFNKLSFGQIDGIPRLLDVGQCNDAYSAIQIAVALAGALGCGVNELPLTLILSWYEQKAVAILLTLLHLDVRNIQIGPSLPAFITPPVLQVLSKTFGLAPITTPQEDLAAALA